MTDLLFEANCIYAFEETGEEMCLPKTFSLANVVEYDKAPPGIFKKYTPGTLVRTAHSVFYIDTPYKKFASHMRHRVIAQVYGLDCNVIRS